MLGRIAAMFFKRTEGQIHTVVNELDRKKYVVATSKGPLTGVWETFVVEPGKSERLASVYIVTDDQLRTVPESASAQVVRVLKADSRTVEKLHGAVCAMVQKTWPHLWKPTVVALVYIALTELGLTPLTKEQFEEICRAYESMVTSPTPEAGEDAVPEPP